MKIKIIKNETTGELFISFNDLIIWLRVWQESQRTINRKEFIKMAIDQLIKNKPE